MPWPYFAEMSADDGVAAPFLGHQLVLGQLLEHAVGVCAFLIDLVDCNNDRYVRSLCMVNRLDGLRHDAVVGCHDQNRNVSDLCAAGTHGRKRRMARGVEEGNGPAVYLYTVCTDVLGNTTASPSVTLVLRMASSREVLPWST